MVHKSLDLVDLLHIDHYRIGVKKYDNIVKIATPYFHYVTMGEVNPFCDNLCRDDMATYNAPEQAEIDCELFNIANETLDWKLNAVVIGVNTEGTILAINGQFLKDPYEEEPCLQ